MTMGTITGTITQPISLGIGNYGSTLVVSHSGAVVPSLPGATALTAPAGIGEARIANRGTLQGAAGRYSEFGMGGKGGDGILLETTGTVTTSGDIVGGAGGGAGENTGGNGGFGIDLRVLDTVINSGTISGGYGNTNFAFGVSGNGGIGIDARQGGTVVNSGVIDGGGGAYGPITAGNGAQGIVFGQAGMLSNSGTIRGGSGGYAMQGSGSGADAVDFLGKGVVRNTGLIEGAGYAGMGILLGKSGMISNGGTIMGGAAAMGVDLQQGGTLDNTGIILGGGGFYGEYSSGGSGASAVVAAGRTLIRNFGTLSGGAAGGSNNYQGGTGGIAVSLTAGKAQTLLNAGLIMGGHGGSSVYYDGGAGGAGVRVDEQTLVNMRVIEGGIGGTNYASNGFYQGSGGIGGAGIILDGGVVENRGDLLGGLGGVSAQYSGGAGGVGVYLNAGTLMALGGVIAGGAPGTNGSGQGDSVQFGTTVAATLVVDPGAAFSGAIAASLDVNDVLQLGGHSAGTLSGFGAAGGISGFTSIVEDADARWMLTGSLTPVTTIDIGQGSVLELNGSDNGTLYFASGSGGTLKVDTPAAFTEEIHRFGAGDGILMAGLDASGFSFSGTTLALLNSGSGTLAVLDLVTNATAADFGLKHVGGGTEVYYKSASVELGSGLHWHFGLSI